MSNDNFGGPAFPVKPQNDTSRQITGFMAEEIQAGVTANYGGMTLRDYFAAKAMQAGISTIRSGEDFDEEEFAKTSYKVADAMLAERAK